MRLSRFIILAASVVAGLPCLHADVGGDVGLIAHWFSQELANATAFNASAAPLWPGDVRSFLGVEVGLSATATSSQVDTGVFDALPLTEVSQGGIEVPGTVLLPVPVLHARVGLPWGLDLGMKYGATGFSQTNGGAETEVRQQVFGLEVRRRLMGEGPTGVLLPDISLGLAYDQAVGHAKRSQRYNAGIPSWVGSTAADTLCDSNWRTGALSVRAVAGKQLAILTPYVGLGYSHFLGDATTTVTFVDTANTANRASAESSADAAGDLVQVSGGLELAFFPTLKLNLGGLWSKGDYAASLGVRFSFR